MELLIARRSARILSVAKIVSMSVLILFLGGCAGSGPRPDAEIAHASTIVDQSEREGSRNYAAFDLVTAKNKLDEAKKLVNEGEYKKALFLAKEAAVDAELATAKTQTAKAKEAVEQLIKSRQTLEKEINKGQ